MEWLSLLKWCGLAVGGLGTIASAVGEFVPARRKKRFKAIGLAVAVVGFAVGIASEWQTQRNDAVTQRKDAKRAQEQRETAQDTLNSLKQLLQDQQTTLDQVERVMYRVDHKQVSASFQIEMDLSGSEWDRYRALVESGGSEEGDRPGAKAVRDTERTLGPGYTSGFELRSGSACFPTKGHQRQLAQAVTQFDIRMDLKKDDVVGDDEPHSAALRFSVRDIETAYYAQLSGTPIIQVFTKPAQLVDNEGGSPPLLSLEDLLGEVAVFEALRPKTPPITLRAVTLNVGALRIQIPSSRLRSAQEGGGNRWTCVMPNTMGELVTGRKRETPKP